MAERTRVLGVGGMSCASCEAAVRRAVEALPGIRGVDVSAAKAEARVVYDDRLCDEAAIASAIEAQGYSLTAKGQGTTLLGLGLGFAMVSVLVVLSSLGLIPAAPTVDAGAGMGMLFLIGFLGSFHCVAMCGGIALSQSLGRGGSVRSRSGSLASSLAYNAGRIVSYTLIGALAGGLGSLFRFSSLWRGLLTGAAGAFMIVMGLRIFGVLKAFAPRASVSQNALGRALSRWSSVLSARGPFFVGLMNGLMPCGPLQAMQIYALGTGSALSGAAAMLAFSLGTAPLMFGFGAAASFIPKRLFPVMVKAGAVLVVFLGLGTVVRAAAMSGISPGSLRLPGLVQAEIQPGPFEALQVPARGEAAQAQVQGGVQRVLTEFKGGAYVPINVQAGIPVVWTIRVRQSDLNGCNNPVMIPSYGIQKVLVPGDNVIEFTPKAPGVIPYSCWMGMIRSRITVQAPSR